MKFHYGPTTVEFSVGEVLMILVDYVQDRIPTLPGGAGGAAKLLIDGADALATHERIEIVFGEVRK